MSVINGLRTAFWWVRAVKAYSDRKYDLALYYLDMIHPPYGYNKRYLCVKGNVLFLLNRTDESLLQFRRSIDIGWAEIDKDYLDVFAECQILSINDDHNDNSIKIRMESIIKETRKRTLKILPPPIKL